MAARYFNWKLATVLVVAVVVFLGAAYALHRWQVGARALQALPLGEAAYTRHDYDEAATQFGNYLHGNPDNIEILLKYADAQRKKRPASQGNLQFAINAYRSILRLDSGNAAAVKGLLELYLPDAGMDHYVSNVPAVGEAELVAQNFLKNQDDAEIRRLHAGALYQLRKKEEAYAELTQVLQRHPDDILSYELMGSLARQFPELVKKPQEQWVQEAVTKNPTSALAYLVRAAFYLQPPAGARVRDPARTAQAVADLEQAQKCDLSDTPTRLRLIKSWESLVTQAQDAPFLEKARDQLRILQEKEPTELSLWLQWTDLSLRCNWLAGKSKDAALEAQSRAEMEMVARSGLKALADQPWDFLPWATELFIRSGHLEDANDCLAQMRRKEIAAPLATYLEGFLAEKRGQWRQAATAWRKAMVLGYKPARVHLELANALSILGDTQAAVVELRTLLAGDPANVEGRMFLARLLAQAGGDWSEVQDQAAQVLKLAPDNQAAKLLGLQARVQLLAAGATPEAEREKAWQNVETELKQLEQDRQEGPEAGLLRAQVDLVRGKLPEAAARLTDLENKYPNEVRVPLLQAEVCLKQDKKEEARSRLQAAVAKFPQALEPVRSLAAFLNGQNQRAECEAALQAGLTRLQEPRLRRDLGIMLAEYYRLWQQDDKCTQYLGTLAQQFPNDILPRHLLLTRPQIQKDTPRAQGLVEEIKALEGDDGSQWRYEQAKLWDAGAESFKTHYPETVKLLQENLAANSRDQASRLLLAQTYEQGHESASAVATYQEMQRLQPDNVPVLTLTVAALLRAKSYESADRLLDQAQQQNLHSPELENLRLQLDLQNGSATAIEGALEKMVARDPNNRAARLNLAVTQIQMSKYQEAQKNLDVLKAQTPEATDVLGPQASLYAALGQADEAVRVCDQVVAKLHDVPAYTLRARIYLMLKQYAQKQYALKPYDATQYEKVLRDFDQKALADLGQIIALEPQKAESWATRAEYYRVIGRTAEGIADIRKALELAPDNPVVQRRAILLFLTTQEPALFGEADTLVDRALAPFQKSPPANTNDPRLADYTQLRLLKVRILMGKNTGPGINEARRLLQQVTTEQPKQTEAWELWADLELRQEDPGKAADVALQGLTYSPDNGALLLLKARADKVRQPAVAAVTLRGLLDQNPKNVEVLIDLADAYIRADRTPQAIELLRQKLPEFAGAPHRRCEIALADALYAGGQRDESKALFTQLMQADPNDPTPTMSLAQHLRVDKRWTEMNQLVQRWLSAHPQDEAVAAAIARILGATGDKQAFLMAEDILRTTLARHPRSVTSLIWLAMMTQEEGRSEESMKLNRQILEIDPNNLYALNNLAWLLCDEGKPRTQYEEALALAQRGLKILPDYGDLLDTRGYAFYRLGQFDQARADFARCLELSGANSASSATPRFHLAMTYAALKRNAEAITHLQQALDLNRTSLRVTAKKEAETGRVTYAIKTLKEGLRLHQEMEPFRTALGLPDSSTVSAQELQDAKALLQQLQKGI